MSSREKYYVGLKNDSELHVKLTGSWQTLIGDLDTFGEENILNPANYNNYMIPVHILEYENYSGYDRTTRLIEDSKVHCPK